MTKYLVYDTKEEALQRSREAWEARLGRPKNPEDVTEFLWGTVETPQGDSPASTKTLLVIDDADVTTKLTTEEQALVKVATDPAVKEVLDAVSAKSTGGATGGSPKG